MFPYSGFARSNVRLIVHLNVWYFALFKFTLLIRLKYFSHRFPGLRPFIEPIDLKKQHKSNIENVQQGACDVWSSYLIPGWATVVISTSSQVDLASSIDCPSILQFSGHPWSWSPFWGPWKQKRTNALWVSWKTELKVANFDKLFLHGFWSRSSKIWHIAPWTPQLPK